MEATRNKNIKPGKAYDHLFNEADGNNSTIRSNANVYDTVAFIPKVVNETLYQTEQLAKLFKSNNTYETCKKIWQFVYEHINYKKDAPGYEQIRSPSRAWHDRFSGVDCDCYSVFISSILSNLGLPHLLRITKYHRDYFQHIYPIVPFENGYITIDCVTDRFNYEVPFSEKKDYPMDLQYLSGIDIMPAYKEKYADDKNDGMAELGRIIKQKMAANKSMPAKSKKPIGIKKQMPGMKKKATKLLQQNNGANPAENFNPPAENTPKPKKKKFLGKMLNVVNKANPATVLLRNGILASMKLNIRNAAGRLRWSYLSPQAASSKGIDPVKFQKLIAARQKLEKIFFGAGGNPRNLKKAILSGKGNKDKAVNGFDGFGMVSQESVRYMSEFTPMPELLGYDVYQDENINGMEGFGELGEPVTLASIAAAAGVIAGIVGMLKDVGNIFQKKTKGSEDFDEKVNEQADKDSPVPTNVTPATLPAVTNDDTIPTQENKLLVELPAQQEVTNTLVKTNSDNVLVKSNPNNAMVRTNADVTDPDKAIIPSGDFSEKSFSKTNSENKDNNGNDNTDNPGFWEKNKKWLKPVAIGVGGLTVIGITYAMFKGKAQNKSSPAAKPLSGAPGSGKKKNHQRNNKRKHSKKKAVALL